MNEALLEFEEKRTATAQIFKRLALEMLQLAALDLSRPEPDPLDRTQSAKTRSADRHSALLWIDGQGSRGVVTFALCCDALNVSVDTMRRVLTTDAPRFLEQIRTTAGGDTEFGHRADQRRASFRPH